MAIEIVMPRLGWTMEEGTLVEWVKGDGEQVVVGDVLFTVETDKALNEVEALDAGILRLPPDSPTPGSVLPVGSLLAYLLEPGEELPAAAGPSRGAPPGFGRGGASGPRTAPTISPRARRLAEQLGVDWAGLAGSGRTGRIVERDVRAAASSVPAGAGGVRGPTGAVAATAAATEAPEGPVRASPAARRAAAELGVDLGALAGRTSGQRIERSDVEAAAAAVSEAAPAARAPAAGPAGSDQIVELSPMRRIIAERMANSARTTAPVTLTTEADATELVRLRRQLKQDPTGSASPIPGYTDLMVKVAAQTLVEHPELNARLQEDGTILRAGSVHVGIAVDTERGLLVPVLRDAQDKTVRQIAAESGELIGAAGSGRLSPDRLQGGTFTITNLGMFEIDAFTPIINLPECAVLGMGRIVPKQVVVDVAAERVEIRHLMLLSLTFDHRLVDGGPAARFLQRVKHLAEQPYLWLVT